MSAEATYEGLKRYLDATYQPKITHTPWNKAKAFGHDWKHEVRIDGKHPADERRLLVIIREDLDNSGRTPEEVEASACEKYLELLKR